MNILVVNAGSSSIKFKLFHKDSLKIVSEGEIEEIGSSSSPVTCKTIDDNGQKNEGESKAKVEDHSAAFALIMQILTKGTLSKEEAEFVPKVIESEKDLYGVGHRVVHGGWMFHEGAIVTDEVIEEIKKVSELAPLHNKANLKGVEEGKKSFGEVTQVVSFDTCYHQTIPDYAYMYAIPYSIYKEKKVRKYGFHGTSHFYLAKEGAKMVGKDVKDCNFITLHLGNGSSACAIENGKSIDTTMGLTPAEGLMMGTRAGDMDPTAIFHMVDPNNFDPEKLETVLNKESGFKGICGSSDVREVQKTSESGKGEEKERAELALNMFCYRIQKAIGSYYVVLKGKVDGIIFGGGIGEHSSIIRKKILRDLECLGMELDEMKNEKLDKGSNLISKESSKTKIMVIPTNEELEIAKEVIRLIDRQKK